MPDSQHCSVVGFVGIIVQVSLGVLSFSVLILKRHCQFPKRPWKIWTLDTSKQVISQLLAHFINLSISIALTYQDNNSDSCLWYFITNIFDNTLGVLICVIVLRILQKQFMKRNKTYLVSGYYYNIRNEQRPQIEMQPRNKQQFQREEQAQLKPQDYIINYKSWLLQLGLWNIIVICAKLLMFLLQYFLRNQLDQVSQFLLGWIQSYPNLQLVLVIIVVPVVMNGLAFWVQDNFLKKRNIDDQLKQIQIQQQRKIQTQRQKQRRDTGESNERTKNQQNLQKSLQLKQ